ncbi:MAG: hypothetical protein QM516_09890, partial [Limnohabitans sp.]|nr:hypothetical protein [Limnohabitans sp.]
MRHFGWMVGARAVAARLSVSWCGALALLAALMFAPLALAADLHVPADHATIQAAINASVNGDTVIVAPGTYSELVRFNGKAITLRSESGAGNTIIDGGALGTTVKFVNAETNATVLEGFTIRNGRAAVGGGMYINSASPTIRDCVIASNIALDRGGGVAAVNARPTFTDCEFNANRATERGGGVYMIVNSDIAFTGCDFNQNEARNRNAESAGGAVAAETSSDPTFANCTFTGNKAEPDSGYSGSARGGAVWTSSTVGSYDGCTFTNNEVKPRAGDGYGGAICANSAAPSVQNCVFTGNKVQQLQPTQATGQGGAVYMNTSGLFNNNTFAQNSTSGFSSANGGGVFDGGNGEYNNCTYTACADSGANEAYGGSFYSSGTTTQT